MCGFTSWLSIQFYTFLYISLPAFVNNIIVLNIYSTYLYVLAKGNENIYGYKDLYSNVQSSVIHNCGKGNKSSKAAIEQAYP